MHFILYLNFSYFINRRNYLDSVPVRPLHLLIDIAVCPLRLAYMKPPVLQFNNIYNLNPTRYRYHPIMKVLSSVILSITFRLLQYHLTIFQHPIWLFFL